MSDTALSIGGIYLFILLGFAGKRFFAEKLDEKSIVILSVYLLQPMLVFWGLTTRKIDTLTMDASGVFLVAVGILLCISWFFSRIFFKEGRYRSVATVASIIGNTGNLGIPLGIALFGEESVIYTSLINLVNVFIVYTVGVYFYSRGRFSVVESVGNIFRLPAIWFGIGAVIFNISGATIPAPLSMPLTMGAYATMVLQLMIFGIYLATVRAEEISWRLLSFVSTVKFIVTPILILTILSSLELPPIVVNILILELIVPMAVMNVNLSALYDCLPGQTAFLTFATYLIFLIYLFAIQRWLFLPL